MRATAHMYVFNYAYSLSGSRKFGRRGPCSAPSFRLTLTTLSTASAPRHRCRNPDILRSVDPLPPAPLLFSALLLFVVHVSPLLLPSFCFRGRVRIAVVQCKYILYGDQPGRDGAGAVTGVSDKGRIHDSPRSGGNETSLSAGDTEAAVRRLSKS